MTEKAREQRIRRRLAKLDMVLHKSRGRISLDNFGGYMICDIHDNAVIDGSRFDLSLNDVEDFLDEAEAE